MWRYLGYVEALKNDYQLVLVDARGHGASDKPHVPEAYRMEKRVSDVMAVLDHLCISKAHYFGYSLGGRIGWGIAKYAPDRFHALIIGGAHPFETDRDTITPYMRLFEMGKDALVSAFEKASGSGLTSEWKAMALENDPDALIALLSWRLKERPGFGDILPSVTLPCLLLVGENDDAYAAVRECVDQLPNATLIAVPGIGHDVIFQSDLVVPHIQAFLAAESGRIGLIRSS
jgi:pimeloyl-ACP methyl ester carboxylesterase